ncbi:TIGR03773 family transporter-associated surface protein [Solirubrobacter taibaiensis]|nr:TIGR03773 family transporter-associated surface protein [Solirubrobacter taibaiensis]
MRSFFAAAALSGLLLTDGHVDYAPRLVDGQLQSQVKHGAVWRDVSAVTFVVPEAARMTVPASAGFLGAPGETVWLLPQTQRAGLLWPGWNTEELSGEQVDGDVTWRLDAVEGPGAVTVYQTGVFGDPQFVFRSADGLPDAYSIPLGTHAHGNWVFSRAGAYQLTFTLIARLRNGTTATDTQTLAVAVGIPPSPAPTATPAPTSSPTPAPGTDTTPEQSRPVSAPALRALSARVAGRTLRLRIALDRRARVAVELRRDRRVSARAKPRTVPAGTRTLKLRLDRRPAAGRHLVRITATTDGRSRTRTIAVRVRN